MRVSELHIYPVKGAAGTAVSAARLDAFGLEYDRRWMVVDGAGRFITQRDRPALSLLKAHVASGVLVLRSDRAGEVRVEPAIGPAPGQAVRVWSDEVEAVDCGDAAAAVVSRHLGTAVRLVHMPDTTLRQVDPRYARVGDRVGFADGFPLLIIGQASLDELNRRLAQPISMLRFRPNIVVEGTTPHAEDAWRSVRIGTVECDVVKPCARCVVTTIDPVSVTAGREPLRTLADYRRADGQVWFGQNAIHRGTGVIAVGDAVEVLAEGAPRPPLSSPARPVPG